MTIRSKRRDYVYNVVSTCHRDDMEGDYSSVEELLGFMESIGFSREHLKIGYNSFTKTPSQLYLKSGASQICIGHIEKIKSSW